MRERKSAKLLASDMNLLRQARHYCIRVPAAAGLKRGSFFPFPVPFGCWRAMTWLVGETAHPTRGRCSARFPTDFPDAASAAKEFAMLRFMLCSIPMIFGIGGLHADDAKLNKIPYLPPPPPLYVDLGFDPVVLPYHT